MSDAMICRFIDEMSTFRHLFFFSPFKVNEPFLDTRLILYLRRFDRMCENGKMRLFTNGSTLTQKLVHEIGDLQRVEHVWVSLNSCDPTEYMNIMKIKFENTARKLDQLHALDCFPHPVVLSKVADDDRTKNFEFIRACVLRWPRFSARLIKRDGWLGHVTPSDPRIPNTPCQRWFELSVMSNGIVSLCCMDGTGEYAIGDLGKGGTLLDVYNAPHWYTRRVSLATRRNYDPCSRCTY